MAVNEVALSWISIMGRQMSQLSFRLQLVCQLYRLGDNIDMFVSSLTSII
jgi:hypothetical protein